MFTILHLLKEFAKQRIVDECLQLRRIGLIKRAVRFIDQLVIFVDQHILPVDFGEDVSTVRQPCPQVFPLKNECGMGNVCAFIVADGTGMLLPKCHPAEHAGVLFLIPDFPNTSVVVHTQEKGLEFLCSSGRFAHNSIIDFIHIENKEEDHPDNSAENQKDAKDLQKLQQRSGQCFKTSGTCRIGPHFLIVRFPLPLGSPLSLAIWT